MRKRYLILLTTFLVSILFITLLSMYLFTSIYITNFNNIDKIINPLSPKDSVTNQQTITIQYNNLALTGYLSLTNSDIYVIVVHGYGGSGLEMDWAVQEFQKMDYNVLAIDLRGHGQSEGDITGLGVLEQEDIIAWTNYIEDIDTTSKIILYGVSMGASTILHALDNEVSRNVEVVIEDSGYTSVQDLFSYHLTTTFSLPDSPFLLLNKLYTRLYLQTDISQNILDTIGLNTIPILFIHGYEDTYVPYTMAQSLYDATTSVKEIYLIEGAGHVAGNEVDQDYWIVIEEFITNNIVY